MLSEIKRNTVDRWAPDVTREKGQEILVPGTPVFSSPVEYSLYAMILGERQALNEEFLSATKYSIPTSGKQI